MDGIKARPNLKLIPIHVLNPGCKERNAESDGEVHPEAVKNKKTLPPANMETNWAKAAGIYPNARVHKGSNEPEMIPTEGTADTHLTGSD